MNIANMSDEELMNMEHAPVVNSDIPADENIEQEQQDEPPADDAQDPLPAEDVQQDDGVDDAGGGEADDKEVKEPEAAADLSDEEINKQTPPTPSVQKVEEKAPVPSENKEVPAAQAAKVEDKPAEEAIDYKAEYEKLQAMHTRWNN
jgi:hypothetical protein